MSKWVGIGMATAGLALLAGCHKEPQGQVAATVNGKEVTLQELNTELQNSNLPPNADKAAAQKLILQRVIDRKLLLGAAEDKGIDKSPEYLSDKRRADEMLLAQAYAKQQLAAVPLPSDADVTKFMADHANAFDKREQLTLDQIRFAPPKDLATLKQLDNDHSIDQVAAHLTQLGIKFERLPAGLDTASAPPKLIEAIEKLPPTEPFVVPANGMVTVNVITGRKPIPVDPAQAKAAAVQAWRQQKFGELINQQLQSLKAGAKITYQNGFAPPPPGKGGAAPAAGGAPAPAAPVGAPAK